MQSLVCSKGHPLREVARVRTEEMVEKVIYVKQKIKHFNREGSEFWTEIEVPDLLETRIEKDRVEYVCDQCSETRVVEQEVGNA